MEKSIAPTNSNDCMTQAINDMRAGKCRTCNQTRIEKRTEISAGFGQGMKPITFFVCGNPQCSNCDKK